MALTALSAGELWLDLYDAAENLLATAAGAANAGQAINGFVDPTSDGAPDVYLARITGVSADYSLVVTRGADFDTEPNGAALRDGPAPATSHSAQRCSGRWVPAIGFRQLCRST